MFPKLKRFQLLACVGVLACVAAGMAGCGDGFHGLVDSVSVAPLASEDLSGPCRYDLLIESPRETQRAVMVIYERGDSEDLYQDEDIWTMAQKLDLALVFAHQCNSIVEGDLQEDAAKGPGRALLAALTQFAADSKHPELADSNMFLFGFSAGGLLSITMANDYPDRVLGAIPFAPGSSFVDLDNVVLSTGAAKVPMLVLTNADDVVTGTERAQRWFNQGWGAGAPWAFAVQNSTGHCCTVSTKPLVIPWVTAILNEKTTASVNGPAVLQNQASAPAASVRFHCSLDGTFDAYGEPNCEFSSASVLPSTSGGGDSAWLPDAATSQAWLSWVTSPQTN